MVEKVMATIAEMMENLQYSSTSMAFSVQFYEYGFEVDRGY